AFASKKRERLYPVLFKLAACSLEPLDPAAIEPPHIDRRIVAQASRFVVFGTSRTLPIPSPAVVRQQGGRTLSIASHPCCKHDLDYAFRDEPDGTCQNGPRSFPAC